MIIHLASDHAGYAHKQILKEHLTAEGFELVDHGAFHLDPADDFVDFIALAAAAVEADPKNTRAIIFGGSGQGEAMLANQFNNVRATVYYGGDEDILTLSREHNDANVLSIGARFVLGESIPAIVMSWLAIPFSGDERHVRRIKKMHTYPK